MNPLQEQPHLFCNGEFQVAYESGLDNEEIDRNYPITGYVKESHGYRALLSGSNKSWNHFKELPLDRCTLIARPIEDMADEEKKKLCELGYGEKTEVREQDVIGFGQCITEGFLYLLSIGVYPFDQGHFEDGTVLDANYLNIEVTV